MSFISLNFLIFFAVVVILYFSLPHRFRWLLLLCASYYFYMSAVPVYVFLLLTTTLISYVSALYIARSQDIFHRRVWLGISLAGNLGLLVVFKYAGFLNESAQKILEHIGLGYNLPGFSILLPIGISFYTFQALSYSMDVYRGVKEPEKHFGYFALYVSFFPQLVAGPIERSTRLLPQFYKTVQFDYLRFTLGLQLMLWGIFKKVAIADRLAVVVNHVYADPTQFHGITLIIATYAFAIQIYCDFSGYSDIAVGAAYVLGYDLMQNFRRPYFATSIRDFWQRWHISLSTWFRDYLYIPLGGGRVFRVRWYVNIMAVFIISGLWHGAGFTFLAWGALHGIYYLFSIWFKEMRRAFTELIHLDAFPVLHKAVRILITFHMVTFAWIFFRAESMSDAIYVAANLFVDIDRFIFNIGKLGQGNALIGGDLGLSKSDLLTALMLIVVLFITQIIQSKVNIRTAVAKSPIWLRWPAYYLLIFGTLLLGKYGIQEFIYFQF